MTRHSVIKKRPLRIIEIMDATGMGIVVLGGEIVPVFKGMATPITDDVEEADVELGVNELDVTFLADSTTMVCRTREVCTVVAVTVLVTRRVTVGAEKPFPNGLSMLALFPLLSSSKSLPPPSLLLLLSLLLPLARLFLLECLVASQGAIS